ncbi:MAG TPA: pirin family protein [Ramlibacter sp.]|uniref:pirin family protein n=1 Tax=Ramlibacter sp. TaxID=1917967 RepID=UPI002D7FC87B|nr:pirin family protein [Ramlibacter sp.]HET8745759.1 pirin family protein [Ramlibacter sp.]
MPVALQLTGHEKDLGGGFLVRRLLPDARQRSVGPFIFFDHFGPAEERPGVNHDVRPHPHIGLATVTYLFEGAMMHRDSLGSAQLIEPGAINWMTAGRGIVHSERRPDHLREVGFVNHGLQLWTALPLAQEEAEPSFSHTPAEAIPECSVGDARVRVLVGEAFGVRSPVPALWRTLYLDLWLPAGGGMELPPLEAQQAIYAVEGTLEADGAPQPLRQLAVLQPGSPVKLFSPGGARLVLVGGEPLDAPRHMWWNFVSSRKERIVQASADWEAMRMGTVPGDAEEFIPLPPTRFTPPEPLS